MLERRHAALEQDLLAPLHADPVRAAQGSFVAHAAGNCALFANHEDLLHAGPAHDPFFYLRGQQADHAVTHPFDQFVYHAVELDLDSLVLGLGVDTGFLGDVEPEDHGRGSAGEEHVTFRDVARGVQDHVQRHLVVRDILEGMENGFQGSLRIGLEDQVEFDLLALLDLVVESVE